MDEPSRTGGGEPGPRAVSEEIGAPMEGEAGASLRERRSLALCTAQALPFAARRREEEDRGAVRKATDATPRDMRGSPRRGCSICQRPASHQEGHSSC